MAVTVETLDKLERKITLTLPVGTIQNEVNTRLRKLARTVKMDGFRPGKVPMNVVAQRYGYSVHYEVMNDKDRAQYEKDLAAAFLEPVGFTSDANGLEIPFTMADYLNGQVRAEDESRAQPLRQQAGQSAGRN